MLSDVIGVFIGNISDTDKVPHFEISCTFIWTIWLAHTERCSGATLLPTNELRYLKVGMTST